MQLQYILNERAVLLFSSASFYSFYDEPASSVCQDVVYHSLFTPLGFLAEVFIKKQSRVIRRTGRDLFLRSTRACLCLAWMACLRPCKTSNEWGQGCFFFFFFVTGSGIKLCFGFVIWETYSSRRSWTTWGKNWYSWENCKMLPTWAVKSDRVDRGWRKADITIHITSSGIALTGCLCLVLDWIQSRELPPSNSKDREGASCHATIKMYCMQTSHRYTVGFTLRKGLDKRFPA